MDLYEAIQYASQKSAIIRERKNLLYTFGSTQLPYVCLSDSPQNEGDVVVRRGQVTAAPPKIALPGRETSFEGFDFDPEEEEAVTIMLARRIQIPPAKYVNQSESTNTERGSMEATVEKIVNLLDQKSDSRTAVIAAPDDVWNLSILLYVGQQIVRSAPSNVAEHFERLKLQGGL